MLPLSFVVSSRAPLGSLSYQARRLLLAAVPWLLFQTHSQLSVFCELEKLKAMGAIGLASLEFSELLAGIRNPPAAVYAECLGKHLRYFVLCS